ncbi:PAS domain S-box protein [Limisalsivibrio acetivorans]|uniref:PAS domain S-box protein n=1 Tax=Limisalsivibrio acetivorans TaxID=1304888 RepID=UPI0003B5B3AF|nr:PAS domain S-box protein [Limisalsivibrio acetivorans]
MELVDEPVIICSPCGDILFANRSLYSLTGFSDKLESTKELGETFADDFLNEAGEADTLRDYSSVIINSSGSVLIVSVHMEKREDIILTLEKSEVKPLPPEVSYLTLLTQHDSLLFAVTVNGIIEYTSSGLSKLLGYSKAEVRGTSFSDFVTEESRPRISLFAMGTKMPAPTVSITTESGTVEAALNASYGEVNGRVAAVITVKPFEEAQQEKMEENERLPLISINKNTGLITRVSQAAAHQFSIRAGESAAEIFPGFSTSLFERAGEVSLSLKTAERILRVHLSLSSSSGGELTFLIRNISDSKYSKAAASMMERFARSIKSASGVGEVSLNIISIVKEIPFVKYAGTYLREEDGSYRLGHHFGISENFAVLTETVTQEHPAHRFLSFKDPMINFTHIDPRVRSLVEAESMETLISIPVHLDGKTEISINLASDELFDIPEEIFYLLKTISYGAGCALKRIKTDKGEFGSDISALKEQLIRETRELKKVSESLERSENTFRQMVEQTPEPVILHSFSGGIIMINDAASLALSINPGSVEGWSIYDLNWNADRNDLQKTFLRLQPGQRTTLECSSGSGEDERLLEFSIGLVDYDDAPAFLLMGRDITEKRRSETLLRERERLFRLLSENSPAGLFIAQDGELEYSNPAFEAMLGYVQGELKGETFPEGIIAEKDIGTLLSSMESVLTGRMRYSASSLEALHREGSFKNLRIFGSAGFLSSRPCFIGLAVDITEQSIQESMVMHKAKLAAMGEMLVNISGQWKPSLNKVIKGTEDMRTHICKEPPDIKSLSETLEEMNRILVFMDERLEDLDTVTAPDSGTGHFNAAEVSAKTAAVAESIMNSRGISFVQDFSFDKRVKGNPSRFSQVLMNILTNAVNTLTERKITEPRVQIETFSLDGSIAVRISDNGGGVHEKDFNKIFEPYYSGSGDSHGLGLYIAKRIIEKDMDGLLHVRNDSRGAVFTIVLRS